MCNGTVHRTLFRCRIFGRNFNRQHKYTESELLDRNINTLGTPAWNMLSKESNWSHFIYLLDSGYIACVMALSIALYPDSGDLAEISINA